MDRNSIHQQIALLADKISFLNGKLRQEPWLHPVEVDLLHGYARELSSMMEQLDKTTARLTGEAPAEPEKISVQPAVKTETEIKTLLEKAETDTPVPEAVRQPLAATAPSHETLSASQPAEETVIKKRTVMRNVTAKQGKTVSLNEKLRKETTPLAERLKSVKKKSIKELFDLNERYKFVQELFGGSSEQFNKVLHDLGKLTTREEAHLYLKEIEMKNCWQGKEAFSARFTERVLAFLS